MERRRFLRWAIGSVIAAGAAITAFNFVSLLEQPQLISVKVNYFQMPQFINVTSEYFHLPTSASLSNLLYVIEQRHPTLSAQMFATMLILVNEMPVAGLDSTLNDGDVVDFIPLVGGG